MAIIIETLNPQSLLAKIYKGIDDDKIPTWEYDKDKDFTHKPSQWRNQAWLKPKIYTKELRLGIQSTTTNKLSREIYGVYHGRFIEMLLIHFYNDFTNVSATPDRVQPDSNFTWE